MVTATRKPRPTARKTTARKTTARKTTARKASASQANSRPGARAQGNARRVFLAGLGVYGKTFEAARTQLKANRGKTAKLFKELVKHGEKVETAAKKTLRDLDLPELKQVDGEELRAGLRSGLNRTRARFDALRATVATKTA